MWRSPDSTDGWKTVQFKADGYIWIPSLPFARSLHGALNSGSRSYELAGRGRYRRRARARR